MQRDISLLVAVAYMNTHPVRVLFDHGSQVNTISPKSSREITVKARCYATSMGIKNAW